jgi:hypothetical protein
MFRSERRHVAALLSVSLWCLAGFSPVEAAETSPGVGALRLSAAVAEHGRAAKDPVSLIVAASIRAKVAVRAVERRPEGSPSTEAVEPGRDPGVEALLDEAVTLSGRDATIVAMADDVRAAKTKGRVDGVAESVAVVRGAGTDWYRKLAFDGTYAEAYAELIGDGRVTISVWDEKGNLVCKDPNPSTYSYCGWNPGVTGRYDVRIENLGSKPVRYRISTN